METRCRAFATALPWRREQAAKPLTEYSIPGLTMVWFCPGVSAVPSEIRHIVFSAAEVAAAIREYRRHIARPLPAGALRRFEMYPGKGSVRASFDIHPDIGTPPESCEVGGSEITEALVLYCGAHNIPLPATGVKSL